MPKCFGNSCTGLRHRHSLNGRLFAGVAEPVRAPLSSQEGVRHAHRHRLQHHVP